MGYSSEAGGGGVVGGIFMTARLHVESGLRFQESKAENRTLLKACSLS